MGCGEASGAFPLLTRQDAVISREAGYSPLWRGDLDRLLPPLAYLLSRLLSDSACARVMFWPTSYGGISPFHAAVGPSLARQSDLRWLRWLRWTLVFHPFGKRGRAIGHGRREDKRWAFVIRGQKAGYRDPPRITHAVFAPVLVKA